MAILEILKYPDTGLKKTSEQVEKVDEEIRRLIDDMFETMYQAPGIGLAAPQVGVLKRVIVLDVPLGDDEPRSPLALVNPEIVSSEGEILFEEGCLSVPDFSAEVLRNEKINIKGLDRDGNEVQMECEELLSVALQHEIDHLNGILFIDRLGSVKRDIFSRKFKKISKQMTAAI